MNKTVEKRYTKCLTCGTMNLNADYCANCGEPLNYAERRRLELEQLEKERQIKRANKTPSKIKLFFIDAKQHKNPLVRIFAKVISSVWFMALILLGILALVAAYLAL